MTNGFLVNPDYTYEAVSFEQGNFDELLGGSDVERIRVSFTEEGPTLLAIVNQAAKGNGGQPNPIASLGKNQEATGNSAFFTDPTAAIYGPVIVVGAGSEEGTDITEEEIESVKDGIRAAENYREDQSEEYTLWYNAASNLA